MCCVDKECLETVGDHPPDHDYGADIADYSVVRVLLLLDNERIVKMSMVVRNLDGGLAGIAKVCVVKFWAHPDGAPLPTSTTSSTGVTTAMMYSLNFSLPDRLSWLYRKLNSTP